MINNIHSDAHSSDKNNMIIERPRINRLLINALTHPITIVIAGAGYGKTRSVQSFVNKLDTTTSWVQLSENDNNPSGFWENYTYSVSKNNPSYAKQLKNLGFPDSDDAFTRFVSLMQQNRDPKQTFAAVFDDFHLINNETILRCAGRCANHISKNSRLVIISRTLPNTAVLELIATDRVSIIGEDDLRFTNSEIREYFQSIGLSIGEENFRSIYDSTNGWAFAVNLLARSLKKAPNQVIPAIGAMKHNICDMLDSEIFQNVSPELGRFLIRLSLIDHLNAELVETLAGGHSLVEEMEQLSSYIRHGLLLNAYYIHHLFLDFLKQKQNLLTDEEKHNTYAAAAEWCERSDLKMEAVRYYEKIGDYEKISQIIFNMPMQIPPDTASMLLEVFNRAPKSTAQSVQVFSPMHIRLVMNLARFEEAWELCKKYISIFEAMEECHFKNRAMWGLYYCITTIRRLQSTFDGRYDFDVYAQKTIEYFLKAPVEYCGSGPAGVTSICAWLVLVGSEAPAGAHEKYIAAMRRTNEALSHPWISVFAGADDLAMGELLFYCGELNEAEKYFLMGISKAKVGRQFDIMNRGLFYIIRLGFATGKLEKATKALDSMKLLFDEQDYGTRYQLYDIASGYYHLFLGQTDVIAQWLKGDFSDYTHPSFIENYGNRIKLRYKLAKKELPSLLAFLDEEAEKPQVKYGKIENLIFEAICQYHIKNRSAAIAALTELYDIAAPDRLVMPLIEAGTEMRTLTAAALKDKSCRIPKEWLEEINRKASSYAKRRSHIVAQYNRENLIPAGVSLSAREQEILIDLSHGLTKGEIAASRNLSINTVKTVTVSLYNKLGANNLADVIRFAIEMNLI
ncbi:MAG: LuxR C-terminal-related transcriptional regulator [Oscillospiraceae bacterium]|nr:LuxR C-terminal-related transcriptional regulator [Oscillospiraceae bacterium]